MTRLTNPAATRRGVLGLMAGAGAGLAAGAQAQAAQREISVQTLSCAEPLMGVSYTASEREQMLAGIETWLSRAEALRAVEKPNDLAPALVFDPRLPGAAYDAAHGGVTGLARAPGLPGDPAAIAYAPVWMQAQWLERGAITSLELTEIYLARIAAYAAQLECFVTVTAERARAEARARR